MILLFRALLGKMSILLTHGVIRVHPLIILRVKAKGVINNSSRNKCFNYNRRLPIALARAAFTDVSLVNCIPSCAMLSFLCASTTSKKWSSTFFPILETSSKCCLFFLITFSNCDCDLLFIHCIDFLTRNTINLVGARNLCAWATHNKRINKELRRWQYSRSSLTDLSNFLPLL